MPQIFLVKFNIKIVRILCLYQKLIYNDLTGNFNYYDEYTAEFDVHTRTTIAQPQGQPSRNPHGEPEKSIAEKISQGIKDFTKDLNEAT